MASADEYLALISELIDGVDRGDFENDRRIPDQYTYEHLKALFVFQEELDGAKELYKQIYERAITEGMTWLRQKRESGDKIKVFFLTYSAAQWPADGIYRRFENDPRVDACVVVAALMDRDPEIRKDSYIQTRDFFLQNGYSTVESYDTDTDEVKGWEELGGIPDILIHLSSWNESISSKLWVWKLPLRCLNIYIPYGIALVNDISGCYMRDAIFNKDFSNAMWRIYTDSQLNRDAYSQYELLGGENVSFSGYVKMDRLLEEKRFSPNEICTGIIDQVISKDKLSTFLGRIWA